MGVTDFQLFIEGKPVTDPIQWADLKVSAAFGVNSNQPEIEIDRITLVKDAAQSVINHVQNGNIFEGMESKITYRQRNNQIGIWEGFLDASDNYEELDPTFGAIENPNKVSVKFRGVNTITNFTDQIEGVTFGYLYSVGAIKDSDFTVCRTAIVKKSSFIEVAMSIVTIYILAKQIRDSIKNLADTISNSVGHASGGITGPAAAAIYAIAVAVIQVAYIVATIALVTKMVIQLIDLLIPPLVNNKVCSYRVLLTKVCEHYGYTFISPINKLDLYHYLPTKPSSNETNIIDGLIPKNVATKLGIPSNGDFGYLPTELFELCKRMFHAKVDVIGNEVHLRNVDDPYWAQNSTFKLRISPKFESKQYNTSALKQTRLTSFIKDPNDEWTTENYRGTSYEVKTEPISVTDIKKVVIKGLDRTDLPVALPSVKTKLTIVEQSIAEVAKVADAFNKVLGKKTNLEANVRYNRTNVLKISQNDYSVAKCVPLENGRLSPNHRQQLSAKVLVDEFHEGKSFVTGDKLGQKVLYKNVTIPFNLEDFQATLKNGTFVMPNGKIARFENIPEWQFSSDTATIDIEVNEIYTNKLKEVYYEPE